jgi:hypothetical protein
MLPWIKRWRDWAMSDLWSLIRPGPQPQALHYSFEKAGLVLHDQPIPWNAEAVLVEGLLRLPLSTPRRKADFQLRLPGQALIAAEGLRRQEGSENTFRVAFRVAPPAAAVTAELLWRGHVRGQVALPVLSRDDFLQNLRLQMPTLFVRLGDDHVACQTFVSTQCKGLTATALLSSPTSLAPLLDLDLQVHFRCERTGQERQVPVRLASSQLQGRQALVTVTPGKLSRRIATYTVAWMLGERLLASHQVKAISQSTFYRSLRLAATRFVVQGPDGALRVARQAPPLEEAARVGPCFLVCSREAGMAGLCPVRVRAQVADAEQPPLLLEQDVLITDGPTTIAPGTLDVADLAQLNGFEVLVKNQPLGVLPLHPAPAASFTNEGGYKPPPDYSWSPTAEEELNERLSRLLDDRANNN